jgi:acyl-CoA synthetase (AMP-forming)/AMP-acid ligase II
VSFVTEDHDQISARELPGTAAGALSAPVAAVLRRARATPGRVALIADDEVWTYGELAERSGRLAAGLSARGAGVGDRVAVHLHNRVEAALTYLACFRLGAIAVPLNTRLVTPELLDLAERTQPAVYVGEAGLYHRFEPVPSRLVPDERRFLAGEPDTGSGPGSWDSLLAAEGAPADVAPDPGAPAMLLSTSGTTGRSKIVIWSHQTLASLHLSAAGRDIADGTVFVLFTPLMHGAGVYYLLNALTQGAVAVLIRQFDAGAVLDAMEQHHVTSVFGLPFMYGALVREQRLRPRRAGSLRAATVAGDVCPAAVEAAFNEVFGVPLRSFWAAAEDVGATVAGSQPGPYMRVIAEAATQILDAQGRPVADGEAGELVVSSPTTSPGYWNGVTDTTPMPDNAFRSGDLVRAVNPRLLRYMGRHKDLIVRGGSNISPSEVEEALRAHPDIADAGVAALPDAELGQRVGALVVLHDGAREDSVRDALASARTRLASYKVPERVAVVDSIPRNALTKIDRVAVARILRVGSARFT